MKVRIRDIGEIYTGNTPSKKNILYWNSDDIGFVKPDIIADDAIIRINKEKCKEFISFCAIDKARIVPKNSVFVTCIGSIGKIGISKDRLAFNQQINAIVPNKNIDKEYLAYALYANKKKLQNIANAPVVPIINKTQFNDFELNIEFDTNKQYQITETLNIISTILDKMNKELELLDELVKARFVELFNDKDYPVMKWDEVFNTTTGKLDSNCAVDNGRYPFFTCSKEVLRIDDYSFNQKALLLAGNNAAGKYDVKFYEGKFNAYQRTYVLDLKIDASYQLFKYQLEDKLGYLQQQSLGGLTKYLTLKILQSLTFIIPSMDKQKEFDMFVKEVDKSRFFLLIIKPQE